MPVSPFPELPDNVPDCHKLIIKQWSEKTELEIRAEITIGGFFARNESWISKLAIAILMLLGGGAFTTGLINHNKIDKAETVQQEIKVTTEATAVKVDDAAVKVQDVDNKVEDVHRAVKKKGPFGE